MQHDNKVTRNVADAALKILMGEEPDNAQFTKEVEKAKTKATEKKSAEDEARVAAPKVDASVTVPESGVTVKEELKGGQHKIDANKNGKIDAEDFKMLRKKKLSKEEVESLEEGKLKDMVTAHMDDGHSFDTAMKKAQADLNKMAVKKASDEHPEAKFRTNPLKPVMSKSDREASKKNLGKLLNKSMKKEETELEEADSKALAAAFKKLQGKSTISNKSSTGGTISYPKPGVTRHKAKHASGAEYGDSSKDTEDSDKEPAKFKRTYKRKSYGARQNYDRGTRVSGKDVNESFRFSAMLESYKEKGLDYIREMNEDIELLDEKNKPTNPALWSKAKAAARAKFDVYPSAYANGWAAKWYKKRGGGWKSVSEEVELTEAYKLKKAYSDDETEAHDVHYKPKNGKKQIVGYIVRHKYSGRGAPIDPEKQKHTVYHGSDGENFKHETVVKGRKAAMAVVQRSHAKSALGEEYEQLDELSAKKLGQYQKKAVDDVDDRRIDQVIMAQQNDSDPNEDKEDEKIGRRVKGIQRAADKLVKKAQKANEEYDQIEEGTPTKKQVKQAIGIARDKRYAKGNVSGAVKAMDKVNKGLAQHPAVSKELKKQNENSNFKDLRHQLDELSPDALGRYVKKAGKQARDTAAHGAGAYMMGATKEAKLAADKSEKRTAGLQRATDKLVKKATKEEVEQIDELKSKTLKSYISKAGKDLSKRVADYHSKDIASSPSKIIKRDLAIDKAKGRLSMNRQLGRAEESVQINEFEMKTTPKGIKRHYELGKKQAAAGKEMGEVSDNYGPYGIHFERGYRDHQDAMAKKKKVNEAKMTDAQMDKREKIVMAMKPKMQGFKDRYGDDAKSVMYATAAKQAMKD